MNEDAPVLTLQMRVIAIVSEWLARPAEKVGVERAREALAKAAGSPAFIVGKVARLAQIRDDVISGVKVRRYVPHDAQPGVIVFFHGGGFVVGNYETHARPVSALAAATKREVIAVDYRLAPEHPYPAAVDDCVAVTSALSGRVVVAGDSAGGALATVVARRLGEKVAAQVLIYPVTDNVDELPSFGTFARGHFLSRDTVRFYRQCYAPDVQRRLEPDCSPLRAGSLKGSAPAYVLLAECDVVHDEGLAYARKLERDGVAVKLVEVPGVLHGFFNMQGLPVATRATREMAAWIVSAFETNRRGQLSGA